MKRRARSREPADHAPSLARRAAWLRSYVERSPTAVAIVHGREFTVAYANAAFLDLSAVNAESARVVIDRPLAEAFNPEAAHSLIALSERARDEKKFVRSILRAAQLGTNNIWQCTVWPISDTARVVGHRDDSLPLAIQVDASPHLEQAEARHRDLTERALLSAIREEDRALEADAARAVAEQAKGEQARLIAEISHEMRTPMQAIIGYARFIERGLHGATDEQREALSGIRDGTSHVVTLINELLQYAIDVGRPTEYSFTIVEVQAALRAAASLVALQARANDVSLQIVPGRPDAAVRADAVKFVQVVVNLLTNAVKFTSPGGTITISWDMAAITPDRPQLVAMRVVDTGCGIARGELHRVFEPYVQVGARRISNDAGVGLGLAISRAMARGMNGDIVVSSTPGVGSIFTLTLPTA